MRSAFHPERVLHAVQLYPDEYDGLYRVWAEQVHHESCGEGKPVSDVHSSLRHGRNPLLVGRTGIFLYNGKLLYFFALWVVGYACMGTLWPILCIVFKQWLPDNLRGFYWSVICCCSSIGTILCNTLSRAVHGNPSSIFYVLSIANLCNAFASYSLYPSKRPDEMSYASLDSKEEESEGKSSCQSLLSLSLLLGAVFISTFNQRVVTDVSSAPPRPFRPPPRPLRRQLHRDRRHSGHAVVWLCVGRLPPLPCAICEAASILAGIVFAALPWASSPLAFLLLCLLLGFFLYIPFSFSELIAMESVDARLASTVISLNGLMSPFGSVFSGLPVDWVIRTFGWECLPVLVPLCFCVFSLLLWT
ncbi:hypothetical protein WA577_006670, partial [Blastocystis sp. JDR]